MFKKKTVLEAVELEMNKSSEKELDDLNREEYRKLLSKVLAQRERKSNLLYVSLSVVFAILIILSIYGKAYQQLSIYGLSYQDIIALEVLNTDHYDQKELHESMKRVINEAGGEYTGSKKDYGHYLAALVTNELNLHEYEKYNFYTTVKPSYLDRAMNKSNVSGMKNTTFISDNQLSYMKFDSFSYDKTREYFEEHLEDIEKNDHLIIDLSNNTGGSTDELRKVLELFLPAGEEVYSFVSYDSTGEKIEEKIISKEENRIKSKNIYLVIDESTASCAELMAMSLRNSKEHNVNIVGTESYGKTLGYTWIQMGNGGYVTVSSHDGTVKGHSATSDPIYPNVYQDFIEADKNTDDDLRETMEELHKDHVISFIRDKFDL